MNGAIGDFKDGFETNINKKQARIHVFYFGTHPQCNARVNADY